MAKKQVETQLKRVALDKIKPDKRNPKKHWDEGIEDSIEELGYLDPIEVDEKFVILAGHGRYNALIKKGHKEVAVIIHTGLTAAQKKDYLLRNNQLTMREGYDVDLLKQNFSVEELLNAGFDEDHLSALFDENAETFDDDFDADKEAKAIEKPRSIPGKVYKLGKHRLLCGDAQNPVDVAKLMDGKKADMVYCDPPYNIGLDYTQGWGGEANYRGKDKKKFNDQKKIEDYIAFLQTTLLNAVENSKDDAHLFYWCDENYIGVMQQIYRDIEGVRLERVCLWIKNSFNPKPQVAFNKVYEACVYGTKGDPHLNKSINNLHEILNKEVTTGNQTFDDIKEIFNLWLARRDPTTEYKHPTQKPITLHEKPLKRCSKQGDIILDLFGGSGSTMIAAEQLGRVCYMMEIDPIFCDVIKIRYDQQE